MLVENPNKKTPKDSLFSQNKKLPESSSNQKKTADIPTLSPRMQQDAQQQDTKKTTPDPQPVNEINAQKKPKTVLAPASTIRRTVAVLINFSIFFGLSHFILYYQSLDQELSEIFEQILLAFFGLQIFLMVFFGRTLGKLLVNIKVVNGKHTEMKLSSCRYTAREILDTTAILFIVPALIIGAIVIFSKDRRSLSDRLFSSLVVQTQIKE